MEPVRLSLFLWNLCSQPRLLMKDLLERLVFIPGLTMMMQKNHWQVSSLLSYLKHKHFSCEVPSFWISHFDLIFSTVNHICFS